MPTILEFPQNKKSIKTLVKNRPVVFFAAPIKISPTRFRALTKMIPRGYTPIFGFYRDKKIVNLAGRIFEAQTDWTKFNFPSSAIIVRYRESDGPALVELLKARRLVFVHGSWSTALYLREIWHVAFRAQPHLRVSDMALVSPYTSAEIRRRRSVPAPVVKIRRATKFDRGLMKQVADAASQSLCWVRQRGAVVARGRKILVRAFNRVWPYADYCLEKGCMREEKLLPSGQQLEKCFSAHAEMGAISAAARDGIRLAGAVMYTTTFPCINCAKIIVGSGIKEIVFWEDYANRDGGLILRGGGIKLTKLKI